MSRQRRQWSDLSLTQRVTTIILGIVQFALLGAAQIDIRRRSADQIRGSKALWTALAFINWIGPIAYFVFGRKREASPTD